MSEDRHYRGCHPVDPSSSQLDRHGSPRDSYIIDDERDCLDVYTSRKNIGRNEHLGPPSSEGVDDDIALRTLKVAGQACDGMVVCI